jgi:hypothetical protein
MSKESSQPSYLRITSTSCCGAIPVSLGTYRRTLSWSQATAFYANPLGLNNGEPEVQKSEETA